MRKKEAMMSNFFYMNEYSLRGQFLTIDDFSHSMSEYTLPLLKRIQMSEGAVLFRKSTFWQAKICKDFTLESLKGDKHVSYAVSAALKIHLQKLLYSKPYWDEFPSPDIEIESYEFDKDYCDNFEKDNCFLRALANGDNIVSFCHSAYRDDTLLLRVNRDGESTFEKIHNLACLEHWPKEATDRHWIVAGSIRVFVRIKEPDNHRPHFHVESEDYSGSFDLYTATVLNENGSPNEKRRISAEIKRWHSDYATELLAAWHEFHG